jgi:hypothetical protein
VHIIQIHSLGLEAVFFYLDEISPNFNLEKMISTYTRDFPWKKWPKFASFPKKRIPDCQIFMLSSSR